MSTRRDRRRADLAAAASARFGQLLELMEEQALLRVYGPRILADLADKVPAADVARLDALMAEREGQLREQVAGFNGDERVVVLADAWLTMASAGRD